MQHHHSVDASGVFSGPQGADLRALRAPQVTVLAAVQGDRSAAALCHRVHRAPPAGPLPPGRLAGLGLALRCRPWRGLSCRPLKHGWPGGSPESPQALRLAARAGGGPQPVLVRRREADEPTCPHTPLPPRHRRISPARAQPPQTSTCAAAPVALRAAAGRWPPHWLQQPRWCRTLSHHPADDDIRSRTARRARLTQNLSGLLLSAPAVWGLPRIHPRWCPILAPTAQPLKHLLRLSLDYFGGN
jgi:ATP-binding cassette subfamily B protein